MLINEMFARLTRANQGWLKSARALWKARTTSVTTVSVSYYRLRCNRDETGLRTYGASSFAAGSVQRFSQISLSFEV